MVLDFEKIIKNKYIQKTHNYVSSNEVLLRFFFINEFGYFVDECGFIVYDIYRYIEPFELEMFKIKKKDVMVEYLDGLLQLIWVTDET